MENTDDLRRACRLAVERLTYVLDLKEKWGQHWDGPYVLEVLGVIRDELRAAAEHATSAEKVTP